MSRTAREFCPSTRISPFSTGARARLAEGEPQDLRGSACARNPVGLFNVAAGRAPVLQAPQLKFRLTKWTDHLPWVRM